MFQKGIWVDIFAFPRPFRVGDPGDRKVKMIIPGPGISGVADISDGRPFSHGGADGDLVGASLEVGVIENESSIGSRLVDRDASALAVEELDDLTISRRDNRCSGRSRDVDGVVHAFF